MLCAGKGSKTLPYTHILDLAEDGFIKPHVDSARVGGLSKLAVLWIRSIFTSAPDLEVYCTDPDSPFPVQQNVKMFSSKFVTKSPKSIQKFLIQLLIWYGYRWKNIAEFFRKSLHLFHLTFLKHRIGLFRFRLNSYRILGVYGTGPLEELSYRHISILTQYRYHRLNLIVLPYFFLFTF
jgi:hypothetical protein